MSRAAPTAAAGADIVTGPLDAPIAFRVGDTWIGPAWGVIVDGVAVNLASGWTVRAQARQRPEHPDVLMEWSIAAGRVLLGSATVPRPDGSTLTVSTVRLTHTAASSAVLVPFVGRYDCEIVETATGITHTIAAGTVRAERDVTR